MLSDSPQPSPRPPHPLALALIERLRHSPAPIVVELGAGSGRNTRAMTAAGITVLTPGPHTVKAQGAIATHALLHGTPAGIAQQLETLAGQLCAGAPLYGTFGSVRDARFGWGDEIEPHVYATRDGDEAGVMHTFFDERRLRGLLEPLWEIESLREVDVDEIAGTWAHGNDPLRGAVHWFAVATKR